MLWLPHVAVQYKPVPVETSHKKSKEKYVKLGVAVKDILRTANMGEAVAMLVADCVISKDWFTTAESYFDRGAKILVVGGVGRTCGEPPIGATASDLRRWAWEHRHPWIEDCVWGRGHTAVPTLLYFEKDDTVVMHGFHLHSFGAFIKDRSLEFKHLTGDSGSDGLLSCYRKEEIKFVAHVDEMGFAEMTPEETRWPSTTEPLSVENVVAFTKKLHMNEFDKWMFSHRFPVIGNDDPGDQEVCDQILRGMG